MLSLLLLTLLSNVYSESSGLRGPQMELLEYNDWKEFTSWQEKFNKVYASNEDILVLIIAEDSGSFT